jgi:cytochrome d ubiquinol oxidase subunit II
LIGRGVSIELRTHIDNNVWRSFFDGLFFLSSALLAIFFGAALANVIRDVPIGPDNYFFLPLWTNWRVGPHPGILDWYTVIGGLVALVALAVHGGLYLAVKATSDLEERARRFSQQAWIALCVITVISLVATILVRPTGLDHYKAHPVSFAIPVLVVLSLAAMKVFTTRRKAFRAFLSSCLFLTILLVGAAVGLYPTLLPSSTNAAKDITVAKALTGPYATHVGLIWWSFGMLTALGYFSVSYGMFRGKVSPETDGYGH